MDRASIEAYSGPFFTMVKPMVARAIEGAAPKSPAKLLGRKRSLIRANRLTIVPPMRNLRTKSLMRWFLI